MGASQSTGGASTPGGGDVKTSYYQLLEVERTATQDELKKAYRKKALELHPDRNHGDTERTTALFAEIQSAYEVLSDEQERAWYDAHERDILRGGSGEGTSEEHYQGSMKVTTADELVRMMGKFRGKVDFSDSPNGFFGYVRETFETLAKEEEYAADFEDVQLPEYPTFGHKDDQYDDVVKNFYAAWNGFATVKSFAWLDVYRLSDAPDRRTRRLAEKENQNYRDAGRREFNEAVRTLVAFVRRRDPRFTPNTQSDEARAKAQRDARKAQAQRARAAQMAKLDQEAQELPNWATARPADELEEESEEDIEEEHFECVACNKTFKSERQYEAHERSKKHQKAIQTLKRKMQKDNKNLNLDGDGIDSGAITPAGDDLESDGVDSEANGYDDSKQKNSVKSTDREAKEDETDGEESSGSDYFKPAPGIPGSQKPPPPPESEEEEDEDDANTEDDEYASRSDIEARLAGLKVTNPPTSNTSTHDAPPTEPANLDKEDTQPPEPKMGKAAQKRAKKAARAAEETQSESTNKCLGCDAAFPSKTQLHQHLQEHPKHAALKSVGTGGSKKKKGKR